MGPPGPLLDPEGSLLAVVSGDSRLKIFNAASQRLLTEFAPGMASGAGQATPGEIVTSIAWAGKGRVAAGTATGAVKVYDTTSSTCVWSTAAGAAPGGATALAASPSGNRLLAVGSSGAGTVLDAASGAALAPLAGGQAVSRGAFLDDARVIACGTAARLLDVSGDGGAELARWTAHAAPASALAASASARWAATAGGDERGAAVWDLTFGKKGGLRRKTPAAIVQLSAPALSMSLGELGVAAGAAGEDGLVLAAVLESGGLEVFSIPPLPTGKHEPPAQACRVAVAAEGSAVLAARVTACDDKGCTLQLVLGPAAKPSFHTQRISFGAEPQTLALQADKSLLLDTPAAAAGEAAGGRRDGRAVVLGASDVAVATTAAGVKRGAEAEPGAATPAAPEDSALDEVAGADERPLGERVAAMSRAAAGTDALAGAEPANDGSAAGLPADGPLTAASLTALLSQALRAGDGALLERCLAARQRRVVEASVSGLGGGEAAALLRALAALLDARPRRGEELAVWLRALLRCHAASLGANPAAASALATLGQAVEARLAVHAPLLALSGRLDLVVAQAQRAQRVAAADGGAAAAAVAPGAIHVRLGDDDSVVVEQVWDRAANDDGSDSDELSQDEDSDDDSDEDGLSNGLAESSDSE